MPRTMLQLVVVGDGGAQVWAGGRPLAPMRTSQHPPGGRRGVLARPAVEPAAAEPG